jgi:Tol biopolymer transport system component
MKRRNVLLLAGLLIGGGLSVAGLTLVAHTASVATLVYSTGRQCDSEDVSVCDGRKFNDAIYAIAGIGHPPTKLTSGRASDSYPALSPDGRQIAFQRYTNKNAVPQIWVMNANGSGQKQLTRGGAAEHPQWSPDGKKILFQGFLGDSSDEFWVINANGSGRVRLTYSPHHVDVSGASWSPSGQLIVFARDPIDVPSTSGGIYVVSVDGTGLKRLRPAPNRGAVELESPAWSPDGSKIAYMQNGPAVAIWTMSADGSEPQRVAGPAYGPPAWSPDSTRIAFTYFSRVSVVNADGTTDRTASDTYIGRDLAWSPTGSQVAFAAGAGVAVMSATGGGIKHVTSQTTGFGIDGLDW